MTITLSPLHLAAAFLLLALCLLLGVLLPYLAVGLLLASCVMAAQFIGRAVYLHRLTSRPEPMSYTRCLDHDDSVLVPEDIDL